MTIDGGVSAADDVTVTIASGDTLAAVAAKMQVALRASGEDADSDITVTVGGTDSNQLIITTPDSEVVTFNGGAGDTSNFLGIVGLSTGTVGDYDSAALKDQSKITIDDSDDSNDTASVTTFSISQDGGIEATYSNGGKLSVANNSAGNKELRYTSAGGSEITSTNITNNHLTLTPAQLQLQLATVINPQGLNAAGGNLFALNSIAGEPTYAIGRSGGLGVINSGSLEASNVDMPSEFANMILAQRGIEANSRTFEVQNQIMRTIVNLGR